MVWIVCDDAFFNATRAGAQKVYLCKKGHNYGPHFFGAFYPPHHKKVLLPGLGCGFVPEITKLVTPVPKIQFSSISA